MCKGPTGICSLRHHHGSLRSGHERSQGSLDYSASRFPVAPDALRVAMTCACRSGGPPLKSQLGSSCEIAGGPDKTHMARGYANHVLWKGCAGAAMLRRFTRHSLAWSRRGPTWRGLTWQIEVRGATVCADRSCPNQGRPVNGVRQDRQ